jgi:hypothetical protein
MGHQMIEPVASTTIPIKRMSLKAFRKDKNKGSLTSVFKVYLRELLEPSDLRLAKAHTAPPDPTLKRFMASYPKLFGTMTGLPVDRPETMAIDTDPEKPLPRSRPLAHLSETELSSLKTTLMDLLARGVYQAINVRVWRSHTVREESGW